MADVFISYSREDRPIADRLHRRLAASGLDVFEDREILAGTDFATRIADEIKSAKVVVVLLSANSRRSSWVRKEFATALEQKADHRRVLPVLLDREGKQNWIWPLIADRQVIDLSEDAGNVDPVVSSVISTLRNNGQAVPLPSAKASRRRALWFLAAAGAAILASLSFWWSVAPTRSPSAPLPQECNLQGAPPGRVLTSGPEGNRLEIQALSDVDGPVDGKYRYKYVIHNRGTADVSVRWTVDSVTLLSAAISAKGCIYSEQESATKPEIIKSSQIEARPANGEPAMIDEVRIYKPGPP